MIGTRDYVSKCGFKKVLVGLSGGVDSAVVAAIAVNALGAENVQGVSMPGPYSSEGSKNDAKALATKLGIELITLPIGDVFDAYRKALGARIRRNVRRCGGRKHSGAHSRQLFNGAVEQIWFDAAEHR